MSDVAVKAHSQPFRVQKVDSGRRLVLGWAMVAVDKGKLYVDHDRTYIPQDVILDSAIDFMLNSRASDEMHREIKEGATLFCWPFLDGVSDDFALPADGTRGLAVGIQFSPAVFAKFQSGEYTGFSGGGDAMAIFMPDGHCPECLKMASLCQHALVAS
jgi:hypothetical protein